MDAGAAADGREREASAVERQCFLMRQDAYVDDRQGKMHAKCSVCDVLPRSGCRASLQRASFDTKMGADPTHQSKLDS
jgi:hypothetical protein